MSDLTRDAAAAFSPAVLANALRTLALIPNSYSPASVTVLLQEAASRIDPSPSDPSPSDPSPSDVAYDDMTRAWRNRDYPLAWSLADALLGYLGGPDSGQPLTGDRDPYYVLQIYAYYAPLPDPAGDFCTRDHCQIRHHAPH